MHYMFSKMYFVNLYLLSKSIRKLNSEKGETIDYAIKLTVAMYFLTLSPWSWDGATKSMWKQRERKKSSMKLSPSKWYTKEKERRYWSHCYSPSFPQHYFCGRVWPLISYFPQRRNVDFFICWRSVFFFNLEEK